MQITVLSVSKTQHMTKTNKPYFQLEIAYKGEDGQVKGKKLMPFGSTKPAFDALEKAQGGEAWDITLIKEGEYWSWISAKKSDGSAPVADTPTKMTSTAPAGKVVGSNYETKEERAIKQRYIVRQSSLANAIALNPKASVATVIEIAKEFETFVFSEEVAAPAAATTAMQDNLDMDNDVPL